MIYKEPLLSNAAVSDVQFTVCGVRGDVCAFLVEVYVQCSCDPAEKAANDGSYDNPGKFFKVYHHST